MIVCCLLYCSVNVVYGSASVVYIGVSFERGVRVVYGSSGVVHCIVNVVYGSVNVAYGFMTVLM